MGRGYGLGQGKNGESHWDMRQKAKAQFSLALMPIFIPSLLVCYTRTCNDISRRWDTGSRGHFVMGTYDLGEGLGGT